MAVNHAPVTGRRTGRLGGSVPLLVAAAALLVGAGSSAIQAGGAQSAAVRAPQVPGNASPKAFVDAYCVTCHNQRLKTADLTLDTLDPSAPAANAAVWEKV